MSGYAPENTFSAFETARHLGVRAVEFDVNLTKCGTLVVIHDEDLKRVAGLSKYVHEMTYQELSLIDVGGWFDMSYRGSRIPKFTEVMSYLNQYDFWVNVELKPSKGRDGELANAFCKWFQGPGQTFKNHMVVSSFSKDCLTSLKAIKTPINKALLLHHWRSDWEKFVQSNHCQGVHLNASIVNAVRIQDLKERNLKIASYTVNSRKLAAKLFDLGVDSIFSDVLYDVDGLGDVNL